jgi:hypothetical protein
MTSIGAFLFFGASMALLAGVTLSWPGTMLDDIWWLNPNAYRRLAPLGRLVGIGFLFLSAIMAAAATAWFKRKLLGWQLAVAIIAVQIAGDLGNTMFGHVREGLIGVTIAGALLFYLLRAPVRAVFRARESAPRK